MEIIITQTNNSLFKNDSDKNNSDKNNLIKEIKSLMLAS